MFSIYPLRGTNKPVRTHVLLSLSYLSTTGDEQTLFRFLFLCKDVFIPYGGRTNTLSNSFFSAVFIYPLRGTNEPYCKKTVLNWLYLSPTGDERTFGFARPASQGVFIPYGGRTNPSCSPRSATR